MSEIVLFAVSTFLLSWAEKWGGGLISLHKHFSQIRRFNKNVEYDVYASASLCSTTELDLKQHLYSCFINKYCAF